MFTTNPITSDICPIYFRLGVVAASNQYDDSRNCPTDYSEPGWHLAIHLRDLATGAVEFDEIADEIEDELDQALDGTEDEIEEKLWQFLRTRFPRMMRLVPTRRRPTFMKGVMLAVEDERV